MVVTTKLVLSKILMRQHVPDVGQVNLQARGGGEPEVSCTGPSGPLVFQQVELEMEEVLRKEQLCYCVSTTIPVGKNSQPENLGSGGL